jgi:hypothetical protein
MLAEGKTPSDENRNSLEPLDMTQLRPLGRLLRAACVLAAIAGGCTATFTVARADEFTDRVNKLILDPDHPISDKVRSDEVLLPLLAAMDKAPAVLRTQDRAALLGSDGPGWSECAEWAQKPAQKAVLEALDKVTKEEDRLKAYVFAQPYGVDAIRGDSQGISLISKEMYTELGEPPLIGAARQLYLPAMDNAGILCHVEASRRVAAGDAAGATKVLVDWLFFCRQMADRPMLREKKWAMQSMLLSLERVRDVVYQDLTADKHTLDASALRTVNDRLKERKGFLQLDKIKLPEGDFIGREQLVRSIMGPDGQPSETTFASFMARASATERPLKLFSAAAYWDTARSAHAGERETLKMLKGVHDDWFKRWELSPFDAYVNTATDYRKFVQTTTKYAVLNDAFNDVDSLFSLRQQLRVELGGTRMSIGAYAFFLRQKVLALSLAALRPEFIDTVDKDPYSSGKGPGRSTDLRYYVPMRDTPKDPLGNPKPFTINLYPPAPSPEFKRDLNDKIFVIYSVGPDDSSDMAVLATQTRTGVQGDYLLFPPTISLFRQRLLETGELK